jgi:L-serine dehydratase
LPLYSQELADHLREIWASMSDCLQSGLGASSEFLPGPIHIKRRASQLFAALQKETVSEITDRLCTYAMAVNEENASGHLVVTAPTNGAAGVIPAVIQVLREQAGAESRSLSKISQKTEDFLLTAAAVGALVKQNSSIAGAEVGCQGEVGTASAMAAAGICAWKGGSPKQVENAAEIALEHHLGLTCDPVRGLVQVPCIERNGFGAVKAWTAAHLALRGDGSHYMPLDNCIQAMRETGQAMSEKFKETSLGGLAVNATEC